MGWRQKGVSWPTEAVPPDTNWFKNDVGGDPNRISLDIIQLILSENSRVQIVVNFEGQTRVGEMNGGITIDRNVLYSEEVFVHPGMTYNIQHLTGNLIPSVAVSTVVPD